MNRFPSSSAALQVEPSSVAPVRVAVHDDIVSRGPGIRKAGITPCRGVQFAERVRRVMTALGYTIRRAASEWGYAESTIKEWRAGRSEPKWSEWEAIERAALESIRRVGT